MTLASACNINTNTEYFCRVWHRYELVGTDANGLFDPADHDSVAMPMHTACYRDFTCTHAVARRLPASQQVPCVPSTSVRGFHSPPHHPLFARRAACSAHHPLFARRAAGETRAENAGRSPHPRNATTRSRGTPEDGRRATDAGRPGRSLLGHAFRGNRPRRRGGRPGRSVRWCPARRVSPPQRGQCR